MLHVDRHPDQQCYGLADYKIFGGSNLVSSLSATATTLTPSKSPGSWKKQVIWCWNTDLPPFMPLARPVFDLV